MSGCLKLALATVFAGAAFAQAPNVLVSLHTTSTRASLDPESPFWKGVPSVVLDKDSMGKDAGGRRTEVRSRWSDRSLFLLFVSTYQKLNLKPKPDPQHETNKLWNWDVAEAFLGDDYTNIKRYKEFEVSPQAEWVDLDIDRARPHPEEGWLWNSGFRVAAHIDNQKHVWLATMEIPWTALTSRPVKAGLELRANFYRTEGAPPNFVGLCWQPTHQQTFHVPEVFGTLRLIDDAGKGTDAANKR